MDASTKLNDLAISTSGFVFDPFTGSTFSVNQAGQSILNGLKAQEGRAAILARLQDEFEETQDDLSRDVDEFVTMLKQHGILPSDFLLDEA